MSKRMERDRRNKSFYLLKALLQELGDEVAQINADLKGRGGTLSLSRHMENILLARKERNREISETLHIPSGKESFVRYPKKSSGEATRA